MPTKAELENELERLKAEKADILAEQQLQKDVQAVNRLRTDVSHNVGKKVSAQRKFPLTDKVEHRAVSGVRKVVLRKEPDDKVRFGKSARNRLSDKPKIMFRGLPPLALLMDMETDRSHDRDVKPVDKMDDSVPPLVEQIKPEDKEGET